MNSAHVVQQVTALYRFITILTTAHRLSLYIPSHSSPVHHLSTHLSNNHFNTIFPSTSRSSKRSLSVRFPHHNPLYLPLLLHTCCTPSPSRRSWPNRPSNICRAAHNVKPCSPPPPNQPHTPSSAPHSPTPSASFLPTMQQATCHTCTKNKRKQNVL